MRTPLPVGFTHLGFVGGRRRRAVVPVVGLHSAVQAEGAPVAGPRNDVLGRPARRLGHPLQLNFPAAEESNEITSVLSALKERRFHSLTRPPSDAARNRRPRTSPS